MAKQDKAAPIGFGRRPDPDPNGTGDSFRYLQGLDYEEAPEEQPARLPKVVPAYVGQSEALEILGAYDIFPLTPLSTTELQLLQVIASLEKELDKHDLD